MMSEAVFFYQLAILASVVGVGVLSGPKPMVWTAAAWAIWTVVMVFTRWLFLFQLVTIAVALFSGFAIQESTNFLKVQRLIRKTVIGLFATGVVLIAVALYFETTDKQKYVPQAFSEPVVTEVPVPSAPNPINSQDSYSETLRLIEAKYPALNPDDPRYRQDLMERVSSGMAAYKQQGNSPTVALLLAIEDMERGASSVSAPPPVAYTPPPAVRQTPTARPRKQNSKQACEYKNVMSDDDYRACGLNPPSSGPVMSARPPSPAEPFVFDKGGHPGFSPNCRWLSQYEWSCK